MLGLKPWLLLGGVVALIGSHSLAYFKGNSDGIRAERDKCNVQKQETINENINIRKKQDRVIRVDSFALIDSLRRGTF